MERSMTATPTLRILLILPTILALILVFETAGRAAEVSVSVDTDILDPLDAAIDKAVEPVLREVVRVRRTVEELKRYPEEKARELKRALEELSHLEIRLETARIEGRGQGHRRQPGKNQVVKEIRQRLGGRGPGTGPPPRVPGCG